MVLESILPMTGTGTRWLLEGGLMAASAIDHRAVFVPSIYWAWEGRGPGRKNFCQQPIPSAIDLE
jgi:hypothetical protein